MRKYRDDLVATGIAMIVYAIAVGLSILFDWVNPPMIVAGSALYLAVSNMIRI